MTSRRTTRLIKAGLTTLFYTGGHRVMAPLTQGVGAIFMLHHVTPEPRQDFDPNGILRVTPEFLDRAIQVALDSGFDIVSLDEAHFRLAEGLHERPFACFTFDDGYRDNLTYAYPIFKRYNLPFAIYVPSAFADGNGDLWWLTLETIFANVDHLTIKMDGEVKEFDCSTTIAKETAFEETYWWLRSINEDEARAVVHDLCRSAGVDPSEHGRSLPMSWDEIRMLAEDPRVTIGSHTRQHFALAKLSQSQAQQEIELGTERIAREIGRRPEHLSYPYGSACAAGAREFRLAKELGYKTAVTTRKGLIYAEHGAHLTALPRVSLNGDYQDERYLRVFLTGAPFAVWNGFKRLQVA
ncbi:MAG: polysaccharide deacetylase family protein [Hyphomicrobiaceae bacterium]